MRDHQPGQGTSHALSILDPVGQTVPSQRASGPAARCVTNAGTRPGGSPAQHGPPRQPGVRVCAYGGAVRREAGLRRLSAGGPVRSGVCKQSARKPGGLTAEHGWRPGGKLILPVIADCSRAGRDAHRLSRTVSAVLMKGPGRAVPTRTGGAIVGRTRKPGGWPSGLQGRWQGRVRPGPRLGRGRASAVAEPALLADTSGVGAS
jgi:hypothetical protein